MRSSRDKNKTHEPQRGGGRRACYVTTDLCSNSREREKKSEHNQLNGIKYMIIKVYVRRQKDTTYRCRYTWYRFTAVYANGRRGPFFSSSPLSGQSTYLESVWLWSLDRRLTGQFFILVLKKCQTQRTSPLDTKNLSVFLSSNLLSSPFFLSVVVELRSGVT